MGAGLEKGALGGAVAGAGRLLIVGGDSQIGSAILRQLRDLNEDSCATTRDAAHVGPNRPFLDLAAPLEDWQPPAGTRAACVLAGVSRLMDCQTDPAGSAFINVTQMLRLIEKLTARGIYVAFLSTDKVFDGSRPAVPADALPCPMSEYGRQNARVEARLRGMIGSGAPVAILRVAKVLAPGMPLLRGWAERLAAGQSIEAVDDMVMAPVPIALAAAAIRALLAQAEPGIFQLSGPRDITYAQAAGYIAERVGAAPSLVRTTSARALALPEGAAPRHTTLDSSAMVARLGITVGDPWTIIDDVIRK